MLGGGWPSTSRLVITLACDLSCCLWFHDRYWLKLNQLFPVISILGGKRFLLNALLMNSTRWADGDVSLMISFFKTFQLKHPCEGFFRTCSKIIITTTLEPRLKEVKTTTLKRSNFWTFIRTHQTDPPRGEPARIPLRSAGGTSPAPRVRGMRS